MINIEISVVIVNYQSWDKLNNCLNSLLDSFQKKIIQEVIIVDNCSPDNQINYFHQTYPNFTFIQNSKNGGFANGCNIGAKHAKANTLLFLNPDTIVSSESLIDMKEIKKKYEQISILSCQQTNEKGKMVKCGGEFKSFYSIWGWVRAIRRKFVKTSSLCSFSSKLEKLDWISGSVVMISKELFTNINGWCEDYWMYCEDEDLCRRVTNMGGEVYLLKSQTILHAHGACSRINIKTTAITKTEVNISRHIYFSKYMSSPLAFLVNSILIGKQLLEYGILSILSIFLFFKPKMRIYPLIFVNLLKYYLHALIRRNWLSLRNVKLQETAAGDEPRIVF